MSPARFRAPAALLLVTLLALLASVASGPAVAAPPAPAAAGATAHVQDGAQQVDQEYTRRIREDTTGEEFLTPLVDFLPASDTVPTPLEHHGYIAGAADHLTYAQDVHAYMRAVAEASPRVVVETMGMTEEGRERILVVISDEETIANLDRYRGIMRRLADPRETAPEEAEELIAEGKAFYWAVGGLHSPETGSPEMLMELTYRLAVEERPLFQEIREGSVVMLTPVMEVDGRERMVDVIRYRQAHPEEPGPPLLYWGKYVAHDNNRDGIGMALTLSRQSVETFEKYRPVVMHDLHESVPFLYIMTGHGPYNPWLDPIVTEEWVEMAWHEVRQMNEYNVPGVWTHDFFDGWATNYMIYAALGRNAIGRFYETFGNSSPETRERDIGGQANRAWFRMNPPYEKVMWSLRNNTNIMQSALLTGMHNVATHKDRFLRTFYKKGRRAVEKPRVEGPAAWMIPSDQDRPVLAARLVNLLRTHGIEVHRLDEAVAVPAQLGPEADAEDNEFSPGTFVVRLDQPYSRLADMLLDYQYYSPNDPRPYDDTGWTLGASFNVDTYRVTDVSVLEAGMEELGADVRPAGGTRGQAADVWLVNATGEPELAVFRYRLADVAMDAAEEAFTVGDSEYRAGTFIIPDEGDVAGRLDEVGRELGLEIHAAAGDLGVPTHPVSTPRIALVHNWNRTQTEGWYRVALDFLEIPYDYISIHDIRDVTDLRSRWDVLLLGPGIGDFDRLVNGSAARVPIPYESSELTPNLGKIASTPDTRPGMGYEGIQNLGSFVEDGGLVAAMTSSASFMVQSGLARYARIDDTPRDLQAQGALFNSEVTDAGSPITYGYQTEGHVPVYFSRAPLMRVAVEGGGFGFFGGGGGSRPSGRRGEEMVPGRPPEPEAVPDEEEAEEDDEDVEDERYTNVDELLREDDPRELAGQPPPETFPRIPLRFADSPGDLLVSGMMNNGRSLAARPAVIDHPLGDGHIVLFATNPMWRQQTQGQFGMLFNTILHWDHLDAGKDVEARLTEEEGGSRSRSEDSS